MVFIKNFHYQEIFFQLLNCFFVEQVYWHRIVFIHLLSSCFIYSNSKERWRVVFILTENIYCTKLRYRTRFVVFFEVNSTNQSGLANSTNQSFKKDGSWSIYCVIILNQEYHKIKVLFLFSPLQQSRLFSYWSDSKSYLWILLSFHLISLQTTQCTRVLRLEFLWCYYRILVYLLFSEFLE